MKRVFVIITVVLTMTTFSFGQQKAANRVLEEGKLLYRLEKASWHSTDFFLENFPHKTEFVGGYVSYPSGQNQVITAFFERGNPSRILARFEFDGQPQGNPTRIDTLNKVASSREMDLITLKLDAVQKVTENENDFFTFYENTSFNFIPLIENGTRRVFILTAPKVHNVILIGNDYLLTYNNRNRFVKKEKLHNSILQFQGKSDDPEKPITSTFHSHVLSDLITSTDICTLLLYKEFVEWKQHYVISKKYVSIFNLETEYLHVMKRKVWDQINELQNNRK